MSKRQLSLAMIIGCLLTIGAPPVTRYFLTEAQVSTPEHTTHSLFEGDTCVPPCWFGLTPGESTAEEVADFVETGPFSDKEWEIDYVSRRDPVTGLILEGSYEVNWANFDSVTSSQLYIFDGVLYILFHTYHHSEISFKQTMDAFGYPDYLRLGRNEGYGDNVLYAIYVEPRLIVDFYLPPYEECTFENMATVFRVHKLRYFSPDAAWNLVTSEVAEIPDDPQPRLLYRLPNEFDVPHEMLLRWLNNEETTACKEVWQRFYDERSATQTAVPLTVLTPSLPKRP